MCSEKSVVKLSVDSVVYLIFVQFLVSGHLSPAQPAITSSEVC